MLHILWLIIKFILILLGMESGLILLAVLLILFCPVRYSACGTKEQDDWKQITGQVRVSWLFHAVSLRATWKEGSLEKGFLSVRDSGEMTAEEAKTEKGTYVRKEKRNIRHREDRKKAGHRKEAKCRECDS